MKYREREREIERERVRVREKQRERERERERDRSRNRYIHRWIDRDEGVQKKGDILKTRMKKLGKRGKNDNTKGTREKLKQ